MNQPILIVLNPPFIKTNHHSQSCHVIENRDNGQEWTFCLFLFLVVVVTRNPPCIENRDNGQEIRQQVVPLLLLMFPKKIATSLQRELILLIRQAAVPALPTLKNQSCQRWIGDSYWSLPLLHTLHGEDPRKSRVSSFEIEQILIQKNTIKR